MHVNRNLKIFLVTGIPFGIFSAVSFSYLYGVSVGLPAGLVSGLCLGFLMFILLGFLHSRAVEKVGGDRSEAAMAIFQAREIELHLHYDRAFDLCIKSLHLIGRCRIQKEDRNEGKIIARSSINWKTWGDTITFDITGISNEKIALKVSSRPTSRSTLVDYGKNLHNVKTIISFLKESQQ